MYIFIIVLMNVSYIFIIGLMNACLSLTIILVPFGSLISNLNNENKNYNNISIWVNPINFAVSLTRWNHLFQTMPSIIYLNDYYELFGYQFPQFLIFSSKIDSNATKTQFQFKQIIHFLSNLKKRIFNLLQYRVL